MRRPLPASLAVLVVVATVATGLSAASLVRDDPRPDTTSSALDDPAGVPTPGSAGSVSTPSGNESAPDDLASTPVVAVANTTSYLALPDSDDRTSQIDTPSLDVAGAVAVDSARVRERIVAGSTSRQFDAATRTDQRTTVLESVVTDLENRTDAIQRRQQLTIRQYGDGEIATSTFLRRMAVVDARAARLEALVTRIRRDIDTTPGYSLPPGLGTSLDNVRARLILLQGPVRDYAGRALDGSVSPSPLLVETADTGVVLASATGNTYVREAYLPEEYRARGTDQFSRSEEPRISAAYQRTTELYPWTFRNAIRRSASGFGDTSVYRITFEHTQGRLTTFVDGTTTNAFREVQEKRLPSLPFSRTVTNTTQSLSLRVNTTHSTGPMLVTLSRPNSSTTVDARITVDGAFVGRTESDGRLWTLRPDGTVTITATTATGERVTVTDSGS